MEIERKFLVDRVPSGLLGSEGTSIAQGYLAIDPESEVRLRRAGEALKLTVKNGHGESRRETEVEIDPGTFDDLWPESEGRRVEKTRRRIDLEDGLVAELDTFAGDLDGLVVVEVEFESEAAARAFQPPRWFGRELTGDRAWANQSLAVIGRPEGKGDFRLREGEDPGAGVARIIAARTAQASAALRRAREADDPASDVHEARKSLKKARSALRLLRGAIPDEERKSANRSCRDAAAELAGARDATVKIETLDTVALDLPASSDGAVWRRDLERELDDHRGDLTARRLAGATELIEGVRLVFSGRDPGAEAEAIAGNLGRSYRRGRRAMRKAKKSESAEDLHAWRKRAKDLRYQLEMLEPQLDGFGETRKRAEELAEKLGDLHDLDVLAGDLDRRSIGGREAGRLGESISHARECLLDECLKLGARTYEIKPGRFTNSVAESLSDAS